MSSLQTPMVGNTLALGGWLRLSERDWRFPVPRGHLASTVDLLCVLKTESWKYRDSPDQSCLSCPADTDKKGRDLMGRWACSPRGRLLGELHPWETSTKEHSRMQIVYTTDKLPHLLPEQNLVHSVLHSLCTFLSLTMSTRGDPSLHA